MNKFTGKMIELGVCAFGMGIAAMLLKSVMEHEFNRGYDAGYMDGYYEDDLSDGEMNPGFDSDEDDDDEDWAESCDDPTFWNGYPLVDPTPSDSNNVERKSEEEKEYTDEL